MIPTEILSAEHQNILKAINLLLKECQEIESGKELNKIFFNNAIYFIQHYADKFHHAKEEDILFKELGKDTVEMHCNPSTQMLYEHDLGRGFVKEMIDGLKNNDKEQIIQNARSYGQLLQEHISKEDNILYPMANEALNLNIQTSMSEEFERVEEEMKEMKEKCLSFLGEKNES
ncbi:cation-binding protein [Candidatus Woesearchaeota archaeon]|jgi:hemerythrin-like domain-containing protein|nr:cation-binding protein [Candidatus Woesearchaeota archaeon]MBT5342737.1 cation-binding protein [Candidatus Woesearchaeota archaeon]